ncbi:hypothetical protein [Gelria sp. Kuro-4]|uniref:hypothetical protein n=1 Tax=Gelria sp. Kuro-4 TaxID=2796927 RepID=UPI001BF11638|nr:hypothetical protein [Gelria sp. Kuro-4]BCV23286.1 hypothetical protein kuro4_00590 [Gelria sp. Kuro-4]
MGEVVFMHPIPEMLGHVFNLYNTSKLAGLILLCKTKDGNFECLWTDDLSYLERLGLLEACKDAMNQAAANG